MFSKNHDVVSRLRHDPCVNTVLSIDRAKDLDEHESSKPVSIDSTECVSNLFYPKKGSCLVSSLSPSWCLEQR
jgi:hypothetical protein